MIFEYIDLGELLLHGFLITCFVLLGYYFILRPPKPHSGISTIDEAIDIEGIVISSSDLESALSHLNSDPLNSTNDLPNKWGVRQVQEWLLEAMPKKVKIGDSFDFGTGLWGHIKPLGYEFLNYDNTDHRLQVVVSIRSAKTDLEKLIVLS
jgi:hypothetical protein